MNTSVVDQVMQLRGVRGAAVIEASGGITASKIPSKELAEFFELLFRMAGEKDGAASLGEVRSFLVRTDKQEDLSLLFKGGNGLAIVSERSRPQKELHAEVGELLKRV